MAGDEPPPDTETDDMIETIGTIVRGNYGRLFRIEGVIETSRASANHLTIPNAVVVTGPAIGPNYSDNGRCSGWSSDLTPAEVGDVASHPCRGESDSAYGWTHVPASWDGGECVHTASVGLNVLVTT